MQEVNNKAKIISISLTNEEKEWLDDMEISPTALMKQKIMEMMTSSLAQRKRVKELEGQVERLAGKIQNMAEFMNKKGVFDEWNSQQ